MGLTHPLVCSQVAGGNSFCQAALWPAAVTFLESNTCGLEGGLQHSGKLTQAGTWLAEALLSDASSGTTFTRLLEAPWVLAWWKLQVVASLLF